MNRERYRGQRDPFPLWMMWLLLTLVVAAAFWFRRQVTSMYIPARVREDIKLLLGILAFLLGIAGALCGVTLLLGYLISLFWR